MYVSCVQERMHMKRKSVFCLCVWFVCVCVHVHVCARVHLCGSCASICKCACVRACVRVRACCAKRATERGCLCPIRVFKFRANRAASKATRLFLMK